MLATITISSMTPNFVIYVLPKQVISFFFSEQNAKNIQLLSFNRSDIAPIPQNMICLYDVHRNTFFFLCYFLLTIWQS